MERRLMVETDTKPTPGQDPEADAPELNSPALAPADVAPVVDPNPRFYRDWRGGVTAACLLSLAAGIWLMVSPLVLDYVPGDTRLIPMIAGAVVACLSLVRMATWRAEWLSLMSVLVGLGLFASGFWFAESPSASWNAWLLGVAVIVLALLSIDATEEGRMEGSPAAGEPLTLR
jgi:peptidoglycan/LPS O-acetylase OafA/YrhL